MSLFAGRVPYDAGGLVGTPPGMMGARSRKPFDFLGGMADHSAMGAQTSMGGYAAPPAGVAPPAPALNAEEPRAPMMNAIRSGMFANRGGSINQAMPQMAAPFDQGSALVDQFNSLGMQHEADKARRREKTRNVIGAVADGMLSFSAGMGNQAAMAQLQGNIGMRRDAAAAAYQQQQAEAEAERKRYEPRSVGSNLVQLGADGQYQTLYNAPEPFDDYAASLGYQPGTPEYQDAVRNYRLGSWSEDAVDAKQGLAGYRYDRMGQLQDHRYDRMGELQGQRLDVTRRGQDLTHGDRVAGRAVTRRGQDLTDARGRRGQDMNDARGRGAASYTGQGRGRGRAAGAGDGTIATNAQGQKLMLRNGKWEPVK